MKNKKVMYGIVGVIILVIAILLFTKSSKVKLGETKANLKNKNNNISYYANTTQNYPLVIIAKNTTGRDIKNLKATVTFYDSSNNLLYTGADDNDIILKKNEITALTISKNLAIENDEIDHYTVEFSYDNKEGDSVYSGLTCKKTYKENDKNRVEVECGKDIENSHRAIAMVYFKGNKIVYYAADDVYSLKENKTSEFNYSLPKDSSGNLIKYDRYELFIVD